MIESKINITNTTLKHPPSWNVIKIKYLLSEKVTDGPHETPTFIDEGYPFLSVDSIVDGKLVFEGCRYISTEDYNKYKLKCNPQKDDIFMGKAASIGKIAIVDVDFNFSIWSPLALLRPNKNVILPKFFEFALKSDYAQDQIDLYATSNTQKNISMDDIPRIELLIPNLQQQQIIINYLDKKTAKIDATIAKNEELIQLLEEKRVALINQVVTKGLNPDTPMKDSGVEWIGEIPEHWKTNKIKNMSYVKGRIGWHGLTSEEYSDEGAYLVTGTDFAEGKVDWNNCNHISYERYQQDPNIHLKENDLLITKDGTIGKLALIKDIPDKATLNSGIFLVRPLKDNYTNDYLYWILSSDIFTRFFDYIKTGATIAHLYQETFERFFFPYMDLEEQNQIVNYLNINISKINATIKKVEESITLLEEYKTSLIHHVVTGKIDVRGEEI